MWQGLYSHLLFLLMEKLYFLSFCLREKDQQTNKHTKPHTKAHKTEIRYISWKGCSLYIFVTSHFVSPACFIRDSERSSQIHSAAKNFFMLTLYFKEILGVHRCSGDCLTSLLKIKSTFRPTDFIWTLVHLPK